MKEALKVCAVVLFCIGAVWCASNQRAIDFIREVAWRVAVVALLVAGVLQVACWVRVYC